MIYGIGTDIVAVARLRRMEQDHGAALAQRLLGPGELEAYASAAKPHRLLAKRFAAKEALGKALGTGLRAPASLRNIEVRHDAHGKPRFEFAASLAAHLASLGLTAHLSLSDEADYAVAFVVLEQTVQQTIEQTTPSTKGS